MSSIPVDELNDDRRDFVARLRKRLGERVVGQAAAIDEICGWLKVQSSGWQEPGRPRARFLFRGPSGVGKTALAAALAEVVMQDKGALITRNLADFSTEGARNQLTGSNPGYVGYGETSTIYSEAMMRPYSLILLENIDLGHEELLSPLLSVLDGQAQDAQGRSVDFSHCIFVLTVTVAKSAVNAESGDTLWSSRGLMTDALLERIDSVCEFKPLAREDLGEILDRSIKRRSSRASRPLPNELAELHERESILDAALADASGNPARNISRELTRWLSARC